MPAEHDLDPPSMTEEERLAKRRYQAYFAFETNPAPEYGIAHSTPYGREIDSPIASGRTAIYVLDPPLNIDGVDHHFVQVAAWVNHPRGDCSWTVQGMFGYIIDRNPGPAIECPPDDFLLGIIGYLIGGE